MKPGFKRILAAPAILFGSALLLASVHAQSSFTHNNNLIPNSVTAFSVATGGTLNLLAPVAATTCPERAAADGHTRNDDGSSGTLHNYAERDCDDRTSGSGEVDTDRGRRCAIIAVDSLIVITAREFEERGECDTDEGTRSNFDLLLFERIPIAENAYVMTWNSSTGPVRVAGLMIDGSMQLVP
jgi:hypothetical protein